MGIDASGVRFLAHARSRGVDFRRTVTIGRQQLYGAARAGRAAGLATPADGYAEPLFESLGAEEVLSLDASPYEGATLIADLNQPLPEAWAGGFTAVYDGGSLEHVFDVPTALRNLMGLVGPGGHLLVGYPANNQVGHGLYQFSPELFYRTLTPTNGFVVVAAFVAERSWWTRRSRRWWRVHDPLAVGRRVELGGRRPAELFVLARRTGDVPAELVAGQQSDYERAWSAGSTPRRLAALVDGLPWPAPAVAAEVLRRRWRKRGYARVRRARLS